MVTKYSRVISRAEKIMAIDKGAKPKIFLTGPKAKKKAKARNVNTEIIKDFAGLLL
jgi:hypothetical protein